MAPIGIGIIGTGYMALRAYLPSFRRQGAVVQALRSRSEQRVQELAIRYNIPGAYTDEYALIADPTVDAVVIATPNAFHYRVLKAAAAAGKAVLCEKPLALNLAQAQEMHEAASRGGIFHVVPYIWRLPDQSQEIKVQIESDYLGQIYEFHGVFSVRAWASPQSSLGWRGRADLAGAGVLADLGSHIFDFARWYVGEVAQVVAQGTTHIPIRQVTGGESEQVRVIDACNGLLKFKQGTQGSFQLSYVNIPYSMFIRLELYGSHGVILYELEMDPDTNLVSTRVGQRQPHGPPLAWESKTQPFAEIIDHLCAGFLRGVREGITELPTLLDGVHAQAIIEAATKSIASGTWETV